MQRMLARGSAALLLVVACDDPYIEDKVRRGPARPDAGTDAGPSAVIDAGSSNGPACNPAAPFGAPVRVPGLPNNVSSVRFSADEALAYLCPVGDFTLRQATRQADGTYGAASVFAMESKVANYPTFTSDGLTVFYEYGLFVFTEQKNTAGMFEGSTNVPPTGLTGRNVFNPWVDAVRGDLYVAAIVDQPPREDVIIAVAKRTPAVGAFTPIDLGGPASAPVLSSDGLTLFFQSRRAGPNAPGGGDIWMAKRTALDGAFQAPTLVPGINGSDVDIPDWVSPDGCRLYFQSVRDGVQAIYVATRGR